VPYLSEIQHRRVIAPTGDGVGRLIDIAILPREQFPAVHWGIVATGEGERVVRWEEVAIEPAHVRLRHRLDRLAAETLPPEALRVARDLLDKPIVETQGGQTVRVNDLQLEETGGQLRLVGVDVGVRGLMRRMGMEGLAERVVGMAGRRLARRIVPWHLVERVEEAGSP
jgi:sporulation protein YlmC with PRC-barrel domain